MNIEFNNPKHEALVNNYQSLCKRYNKKGINCADEILDTINVLFVADTLFDVPPSFRPHPLKGIYKGSFAVDVNNKYRLIFKPNSKVNYSYRIDNYKSIKEIIIVELYIDYH